MEANQLVTHLHFYMKNYIILGILLAILTGSAFYWYEFRPSKIRPKCNQEAIDRILELEDRKGLQWEDYEYFYQFCIRSEGLRYAPYDTR